MLGRTDSRLRLVALLGVFVVIATLLGARLAYWQLGQGTQLRLVADSQMQRPETEQEVRRGDITDRRGNILATTAYRDLLAAYPDQMTDKQRQDTAAGLATILGLDAQQQADLLASFGTADSAPPYTVVSRQITDAQSDQVRAALASGALVQLGLEPHPVRVYPSAGGAPGTTLASQLLGFVTQDGQGRYGVEQASQAILAGAGSATADASDNAPLPQTGGSVQLTIDASLQLRLEKELYAAWVADRAPRVTALVMDPYTGAILAWGSVPGYDENDYAAIAQDSPDLFADPIGSQVYEPGSVMKMFTAAAAANVHQVISPELSATLRELMIHVVDEGPNYAAETKIPGYVVGGKTGTAQIWDATAGGWLADTYNHTFVGFVGNDKPEAIILVRIHDTIPRVPKKWGMSLEVTSNELWRRVALDAIAALDLQPLGAGDGDGTTDSPQTTDTPQSTDYPGMPTPTPDATAPTGQPTDEPPAQVAAAPRPR
jgi:cell division protein FtsI/penicillin-binding protein 2